MKSLHHNIRTGNIIHLFAILHALVAFVCASLLISDQLILTLLTILLTIIICFRKNAGVDFIASCVILVNIIGYLMGTAGANFVSRIFSNIAWSHALSSLLTTEAMGWSTLLIAKFALKQKDTIQRDDKWKPNISTFVLIILVILAFRIIYTLILRSDLFNNTSPHAILKDYFSTPIALLIIICINIIYVRYLRKKQKDISYKIGVSALFILCTSLISSVFTSIGEPYYFSNLKLHHYLQHVAITSLVEITSFTIIFLVDNVMSYRVELNKEREKANQARYRYMTLKQQVDPHFLFNSLNILDCLVTEGKAAQASTYIHKLAGIYRYMIRNEEEELVELNEEMRFVNMYIDLLKVRFPESFSVNISIPQVQMVRKVVPCSIQLLIENAIKHNRISEAQPLEIIIDTEGNNLRVTNKIQPKISQNINSSKIGLKYIDKEYQHLAGLAIEIIHNEKIHQVKLPLL